MHRLQTPGPSHDQAAGLPGCRPDPNEPEAMRRPSPRAGRAARRPPGQLHSSGGGFPGI